jgi:hypothetical protein
MAESRKHHYVPQGYQRGFARQKGKAHQVYVLDLATGEGGLRNVQDTFAIRDWNAIQNEDGTRNQDVEHFLATEIDDPGARALLAMRSGRYPLTPEQRGDLAVFMAAQMTRGVWTRENFVKFAEESARMMLRTAASNYGPADWIRVAGEVPTDEIVRRIIHNEDHMEIHPTNALILMTVLDPIDDVAPIFSKRVWTLVRFAEPCLLTAENPVVHINPYGEAGWGVGTAERMYMPVSPTLGLVMSAPWSDWPEEIVNGSADLAERLNWAIVSYPATRYVLMHPDLPEHPLPGAPLLANGERWPWPPDPDAKPPIFLSYMIGRRRARETR